MSSSLDDVTNAVRSISFASEIAGMHRALKDIRTELDLAPLLKLLLEHRSDFEAHSSAFHKAMRDNKPEIDWQPLNKLFQEQRLENESNQVNLVKTIRETIRDSALDIKPIQAVIRETKLETDQVLSQVVKTNSELHTAVSWTLPSKLSDIYSQGEMVLKNQNMVETSLMKLLGASDVGSRSFHRSDEGSYGYSRGKSDSAFGKSDSPTSYRGDGMMSFTRNMR
jgi:hypothetical protein